MHLTPLKKTLFTLLALTAIVVGALYVGGYAIPVHTYNGLRNKAFCRGLLALMKLPVTKIPDKVFDDMYAQETAQTEKYNKALYEPWTAVGMTASEWAAAEKRANAQTQRHITVRGVSANALHSAYDSNELAADEQYRGKKLNITGTVYQIGRDISGSPFVVIGGSGMLDGVQCIFPDAASRKIALLKKGDKVVVIGKIAGKVATWVLVTDCAFQ